MLSCYPIPGKIWMIYHSYKLTIDENENRQFKKFKKNVCDTFLVALDIKRRLSVRDVEHFALTSLG
jgi:hypothetical protein